LNVEGKRVQEDVGGRDPSKLPKTSLSPSSILNVEGKRVQEDVGGRDPSKLPKTSSSQDVGGRVPDITQSELSKTFEKVEGKHVAGEDLDFLNFNMYMQIYQIQSDYDVF
jgi:hypothetical protein